MCYRTSATTSVTPLLVTSSIPTVLSSTGSQTHRILGNIPKGALQRVGCDWLYDRRSVNQERPDNVLFSLRHEAEIKPGPPCRLHHQSERSIDETNCPRTDQPRGWLSRRQTGLDDGLWCEIECVFPCLQPRWTPILNAPLERLFGSLNSECLYKLIFLYIMMIPINFTYLLKVLKDLYRVCEY